MALTSNRRVVSYGIDRHNKHCYGKGPTMGKMANLDRLNDLFYSSNLLLFVIGDSGQGTKGHLFWLDGQRFQPLFKYSDILMPTLPNPNLKPQLQTLE